MIARATSCRPMRSGFPAPLPAPSRLTPALAAAALALAAQLGPSRVLAQATVPTAQEQPLPAPADDADNQVQISRDFLAELADNLKTMGDFGKLLYDTRDLKPPPDASPATTEFYSRIAPAREALEAGGHETPSHYEPLANIYDVSEAIHQDLEAPHTDPVYATLTSHTLEALHELGLNWVTSSNVREKFAAAGQIGQPFAKYADFLSFGADDLAIGVARGAGNGDWRDPVALSHLLDALNRGSWAAVGYMVSGGDRQVADLFSVAAGLVAATARDLTVDRFAAAYMKHEGFDQAILDEYAQAQSARLAHNQSAQSFEQFVRFSPEMLNAIDPALRSEADARFGIRPSAAAAHGVAPPPVVVYYDMEITNEICRSGFCVRSRLSPDRPIPLAVLVAPVGGVRDEPHPVRVGSSIPDLGAGVLARCAAATPLCPPN